MNSKYIDTPINNNSKGKPPSCIRNSLRASDNSLPEGERSFEARFANSMEAEDVSPGMIPEMSTPDLGSLGVHQLGDKFKLCHSIGHNGLANHSIGHSGLANGLQSQQPMSLPHQMSLGQMSLMRVTPASTSMGGGRQSLTWPQPPTSQEKRVTLASGGRWSVPGDHPSNFGDPNRFLRQLEAPPLQEIEAPPLCGAEPIKNVDHLFSLLDGLIRKRPTQTPLCTQHQGLGGADVNVIFLNTVKLG